MNKDFLKETAKEYSERYAVRLIEFLNEFEADETDFVNKELEYFENTLYDLEKSEASHDGFSITGINNFLMAYDLVQKIGWEKFYYSTKKKINFLENKKVLPPQQTETKSEPTTPETKPIFKPESIQIIFDLLKDFFSKEHQTQLKHILETGNNASVKLTFLDTGNRLADFFKRYIENDNITGCTKKELENWIQTNFLFRHRGEIKPFKARYLNDIISTNKPLCKKPIK